MHLMLFVSNLIKGETEDHVAFLKRFLCQVES